jgi:hypothetical protein
MKEKKYKVGYVEYGYSVSCRKWTFKVTPKNQILLACHGAENALKVAKAINASIKRNLKKEGLQKVDPMARGQVNKVLC